MSGQKKRSSRRRPLSELLSEATAAYAQDAESALDESAEMPPLAVWANVLRPIGPDGCAQRDLRSASRLSKRAVHGGLRSAIAGGWVEQQGTRLALTPRGREADEAWDARVRAVEDEWSARFGEDVIGELRGALETVVGRFDLELPHHPASYGDVDPSIAGGPAMRWGRPHARRTAALDGFTYDFDREQAAADAWESESGGRLYVGEHGQDWRPVPRTDGDNVHDLPLSALLSQATVGITIDYEGSGGISLAVAAAFLRNVRDEGFPFEANSAKAFSGLERHAYVSVDPDPVDGDTVIVRLTQKGRNIRDAYEPVLEAVEGRWKRRYGTSAVRTLRRSLETVLRLRNREASR